MFQSRGLPLVVLLSFALVPMARAETINPGLAKRLQTYFADSARKQLGAMEPWQKKLFDEEALPGYQRFIRDYRSGPGPNGSSSVEAQIDFDTLKHFLKFYAPKSSQAGPSLAVVVLKAEEGCPKCVASLAEVKATVVQRLDHRGLKPIWASPADLGKDSSASDAELADAAIQYAVQKKAVGALLLNWQKEPADEEHPDDNQYSIHSIFAVRDLAKSEGELKLTDNNDFERFAGKLLTDAFTEMGAQSEKLAQNLSEQGREEIRLEVSGIRGFPQYAAVRRQLQESLASLGSVDDRRIARGKAVFVVLTQSTPANVRNLLGKMKVDGVKLSPVTVEGQDLRLQILNPSSQGAPEI